MLGTRRTNIRVANYVVALLALVTTSFAQFDGLPIPAGTYTWDEANTVGICSQLLEAVTERCAVTEISAPEIVQSWPVLWGYSNTVVVVPIGTNNITVTNTWQWITNIVTTNCIAPFDYADSTGTVRTVYPPVTRAFISALDSKIATLIPYFINTNMYDATTRFDKWFALTNSSGAYPTDFPVHNFVQICSNKNIGKILSATTNKWYDSLSNPYYQITGGTAYYTRQPMVTNNWTLGELYLSTRDGLYVTDFSIGGINGIYARDIDNVRYYTNTTSAGYYIYPYGNQWFAGLDPYLNNPIIEKDSPVYGAGWVYWMTTNKVAGIVNRDLNLYWQYRKVADYELSNYDASLLPYFSVSCGTQNLGVLSINAYVIGYISSNGISLPYEKEYTVISTNQAINEKWYKISSISSTTPTTTYSNGLNVAVQYRNYDQYGDQPFFLDATHINERVNVLKELVWTKGKNKAWANASGLTNAVWDSQYSEDSNYNYIWPNEDWPDMSARTPWTAMQASPYYSNIDLPSAWWTMFFDYTEPAGYFIENPWVAWNVEPLADPYANPNPMTIDGSTKPQFYYMYFDELNFDETVIFEAPLELQSGEEEGEIPQWILDTGFYNYAGNRLHIKNSEQHSFEIQSQVVISNLPTAYARDIEYYTYDDLVATTNRTFLSAKIGVTDATVYSDTYTGFSNYITIATVTNIGDATTYLETPSYVLSYPKKFGTWNIVQVPTNTYTNSVNVDVEYTSYDNIRQANYITLSDWEFGTVDCTRYNDIYYHYAAVDVYDDVWITFTSYTPLDSSNYTNVNATSVAGPVHIYFLLGPGEEVCFTATEIDQQFYYDVDRSSVTNYTGITGTVAYASPGYEYGDVTVTDTRTTTNSILGSNIVWYIAKTNDFNPALGFASAPYQRYCDTNMLISITTTTITQAVSNSLTPSVEYNQYVYIGATNNLFTQTNSESIYWGTTNTTITNTFAQGLEWSDVYDSWQYRQEMGQGEAHQVASTNRTIRGSREAILPLIKWNVDGGLKRY